MFLARRFDPGFRFTEYPGDGKSRRHALLVFDPRAVRECRAVQRVPFDEGADPEFTVALAQRGDHLDTAIASAGAVGRPRRRGEGRLHGVEVAVIALVGI